MPAVLALSISIEREECSACRACEDKAPETFHMDDEDLAVQSEPPWDTREDILDAAASCPTNAIRVVDTETGEQLWPA